MCRMRRVATLVWLVCVLVGGVFVPPASAQWYIGDGIAWYGRPNGKRVGDCQGNCGAGCSSTLNPCGGPRQYWELAILEKHVTAEGEYEECVPEGDSLPRLYWVQWTENEGLAEWRYYGYAPTGCGDHDQMCSGWWDPSCYVTFVGCGTAIGRVVWKYQEWIWGVREYRESIGWGTYGQC